MHGGCEGECTENDYTYDDKVGDAHGAHYCSLLGTFNESGDSGVLPTPGLVDNSIQQSDCGGSH